MARTIRIILGEYFQSPAGSMNFPSYFNYINTAGKHTARSMMDLEAIFSAAIEEQERQNIENAENFKQIFEILAKLVKDLSAPKAADEVSVSGLPPTHSQESAAFKCEVCGKELSTKLALAGHSRSHKDKL